MCRISIVALLACIAQLHAKTHPAPRRAPVLQQNFEKSATNSKPLLQTGNMMPGQHPARPPLAIAKAVSANLNERKYVQETLFQRLIQAEEAADDAQAAAQTAADQAAELQAQAEAAAEQAMEAGRLAKLAAAKAKVPKLEKQQQDLLAKEKGMETVISHSTKVLEMVNAREKAAKEFATRATAAAAITLASAAALSALVVDAQPVVHAAEALAAATALGAVGAQVSASSIAKEFEETVKTIAASTAGTEAVAAEAAKVAAEAREAAAVAAAGVGSQADIPEASAPDWFMSAEEVLKAGEDSPKAEPLKRMKLAASAPTVARVPAALLLGLIAGSAMSFAVLSCRRNR
eukprot:gnl/TRDRNA2_/TRDRNA2_83865_c0_seq1.p1 gnl/TRDRNA2_/TRDRNA2_83865_c0~~gnl/TRDRNA2_/TRDRNA2_83865_c0_seq1.p1  ORF type:complete len:348 (-),score=83.85 gnl/TRDRNA2_/TRDRNA2_83865_c0_seq1:7-1050(-)